MWLGHAHEAALDDTHLPASYVAEPDTPGEDPAEQVQSLVVLEYLAGVGS
jgi:hypothetical protein